MASSTLRLLPIPLPASLAPPVSPVATSVSAVLLVCGATLPTTAVRLLFVILFLEVLTCSSVEDPINGVTWPQTNAGATANATCAYDSSVITRPCTLEGTWGAISGSCRMLSLPPSIPSSSRLCLCHRGRLRLARDSHRQQLYSSLRWPDHRHRLQNLQRRRPLGRDPLRLRYALSRPRDP